MNNITSRVHIYYIDFEYSQREAAVGGNQLFTMSQILHNILSKQTHVEPDTLSNNPLFFIIKNLVCTRMKS